MKINKTDTKYWINKIVVSRHNGTKVRVWQIIDDRNFSGVVVESPYPKDDDDEYIGYSTENWNIIAFELANSEIFKVMIEQRLKEKTNDS